MLFDNNTYHVFGFSAKATDEYELARKKVAGSSMHLILEKSYLQGMLLKLSI